MNSKKFLACLPKKDLTTHRKDLLDKIAFPTRNEIRRHRLPLHQCILEELKEGGLSEAVEYIKKLIKENEELREDDERIPKLINSRAQLGRLKEGIINVHNPKVKKSLAFLKMACQFFNDGRGWFWLSDKLYKSSIKAAEDVEMEMVCRFAYARFLFRTERNLDGIIDILVFVRDQSDGKDWLTPTEDGNEERVSLFLESCVLLHSAFMKKVKNIKRIDPTLALDICDKAVKMAIIAERIDMEAEALTEMGQCQLILNDFKSSLKHFTAVLNLYENDSNFLGSCEGHHNLAIVLKRLRDIGAAETHLDAMGLIALEKGFYYELAQALELLGELFLTEDQPKKATPHFREAFFWFSGYKIVISENEQSNSQSEERSTEIIRRLSQLRTSQASRVQFNRQGKFNKSSMSFVLRNKSSLWNKSLAKLKSMSEFKLRRSTHLSVDPLSSSIHFANMKRKDDEDDDAAVRESVDNEQFLEIESDPGIHRPVESKRTRAMYAISAGLEMMPIFLGILVKSEFSMEARAKIIEWKLTLKPIALLD